MLVTWASSSTARCRRNPPVLAGHGHHVSGIGVPASSGKMRLLRGWKTGFLFPAPVQMPGVMGTMVTQLSWPPALSGATGFRPGIPEVDGRQLVDRNGGKRRARSARAAAQPPSGQGRLAQLRPGLAQGNQPGAVPRNQTGPMLLQHRQQVLDSGGPFCHSTSGASRRSETGGVPVTPGIEDRANQGFAASCEPAPRVDTPPPLCPGWAGP